MQLIVHAQDRLLVRQVKEWTEILIQFETRNRFEIFDEDGQVLGFAAEESRGFLGAMARNFLGACRAATLHIYDRDGQEVGRGEKPFRWYFHRMDVYANGERIGSVERRFSLFHRIFAVENASGERVLIIKSPFFRIWTFKLLMGEEEIGRISKQWSGLLKESFTDADNFGIELPSTGMGDDIRAILLVATFLVDFVHFENNNRRR